MSRPFAAPSLIGLISEEILTLCVLSLDSYVGRSPALARSFFARLVCRRSRRVIFLGISIRKAPA
jgi:hypothetical protein